MYRNSCVNFNTPQPYVIFHRFMVCHWCVVVQGVRGVLRNSDDVTGLLQDWRSVDVEAMILQPEACSVNPDLYRECEYRHK